MQPPQDSDPENQQPDLTTAEVARIMRLSKSTLARYRDKHIGPPCYPTPGGHYRYPVAGLRLYQQEQERQHSDPTEPPPVLTWENVGTLRWSDLADRRQVSPETPDAVPVWDTPSSSWQFYADDDPEHAGGPMEPDPDEYDPNLGYPDPNEPDALDEDDEPDQTGT